MELFALVIPTAEDLQRHETSPITMGTSFAHLSVFEKGLLE
jgi:hypothetical protein